MSTDLMERKLIDLQERVERLESREVATSAHGQWREAIGFAKDDDLFRQAMGLAARLREDANREGH